MSPRSTPSADLPERADELSKARDSYRYVADARMLGNIARHEHAEVVHDFSLPLVYRELKHHVDPVDWRAGYLDVHDYYIPDLLLHDIRICAPQALLRDLHRPVRDDVFPPFEELMAPRDRAGLAGVAEARAARVLEARPSVEPTVRAVAERQSEWRAFMRKRWPPHMPDEAPRQKVMVVLRPKSYDY